MPNPVIPVLKDWLLVHEGDIANGVLDFGELKPVFAQLWGRLPSLAKEPTIVTSEPPAVV